MNETIRSDSLSIPLLLSQNYRQRSPKSLHSIIPGAADISQNLDGWSVSALDLVLDPAVHPLRLGRPSVAADTDRVMCHR